MVRRSSRDFSGPGLGVRENRSAVIKCFTVRTIISIFRFYKPLTGPLKTPCSNLLTPPSDCQKELINCELFGMPQYFEDVEEDGGCTTLVPGSNALMFDPRHAFRMTTKGEDVHSLAESSDAYYHVLPQQAMPGHVKLKVKAGDVALFEYAPVSPAHCSILAGVHEITLMTMPHAE